MKLRILGCSGGIGGALHTTCMLLDGDILIDAGTGANRLEIEELCKIDHIFVTHSHLDHVACIPLIIDSVGYMRNKPVVIHALPETIAILQDHMFNWKIWPDFSVIPSKEAPFMRFEPFALGQTIDIGGRKITSLPAVHTVPAVGFHLDSGEGSLVFSGDTANCDALAQIANGIENLRHLIIETAFSNEEIEVAMLAQHLCPSLLALELAKFKTDASIYITHLKPGEIELIMKEVEEDAGRFNPQMLHNDQKLEF